MLGEARSTSIDYGEPVCLPRGTSPAGAGASRIGLSDVCVRCWLPSVAHACTHARTPTWRQQSVLSCLHVSLVRSDKEKKSLSCCQREHDHQPNVTPPSGCGERRALQCRLHVLYLPYYPYTLVHDKVPCATDTYMPAITSGPSSLAPLASPPELAYFVMREGT